MPTSRGTTTPLCATGQLAITIGGGSGGAAGSVYTAVNFVNHGESPCVLDGHPGVSYVDAEGHQVGAGARRALSPSRVVLATGGRAHATLRILHYEVYDPAKCRAVPVRGFRVYPPDQTTSVSLPAPGTACSNTASHLLTVDAVRPGPPTT